MARALRQIKEEDKEDVAIIAYHFSDIFELSDTQAKTSFYNPPYRPHCFTDGILSTLSSYSTIRGHVNQRKNTNPPVTITMASSCPALSGNASITVKNISNSSISGKLHFAVKERHIDHAWQDFKEVEFCNRGMIPNSDGESITLEPGASVIKERAFTIKSDWIKDNCRLIAFLQKSDKEIVEGCAIDVNEGTNVSHQKVLKENVVQFKYAANSFRISSHFLGRLSISIIDLQGRKLFQFSSEKAGEWIKIPDVLSTGIHIIKISSQGRVYIQKFSFMKM